MKTCPACNRTFENTLTFCLVDGSVLSAPHDSEQTFSSNTTAAEDAPPHTAVMYPTTRLGQSPVVPTMVAPKPPTLYQPNTPEHLPEKKSGKLWLVVGTASALLFLTMVAGIVGFVWLGKDDTARNDSNSNVVNANASPRPTATVAVDRDSWEPRIDNASLNGENLTYYRGTTPEQCQEDCDKEKACRGFTYIRAGAYNPNDPAMCYQASKVTGMATHPCCISAKKHD